MRLRHLVPILPVLALAAVPAVGAAPGVGHRATPTAGVAAAATAPLIRLEAGAFDPLAAPGPRRPGMADLDEREISESATPPWLVQVHAGAYAPARQVLAAADLRVLGTLRDDTYVVRARLEQAAALRRSGSVRWVGLLQPAWKIPAARDGGQGILARRGTRDYLVHGFRRDPGVARLVADVAAVRGVDVVSASGPVVRLRATAAQLPALAALPSVQWVTEPPEMALHNSQARWVNDTGVRDLQNAIRPDRLTGAGQTAGVADTGVNYTTDSNGRAHAAFRDCAAYPQGCRVADYTSTDPGPDELALQDVTASGATHRKMSGYFDLGGSGVSPPDDSAHGTHVAGSVTADYGSNGVWDGEDGMAPAARLVFQSIATPAGTLGGIPDDIYQLFRQAYRPRDPASVPEEWDPDDYANYRPGEDARTHNNSYGAALNSTDPLGTAPPLDEFVWEHEDMLIVFSAGNSGPGVGTVGSPSVAKNDITSGASANGRQPMASIDTMASFSSHGPSADGRFAVDLATPGQIVVSPKGGSADDDHYLQGTSMSAPVLTGLATLVRQYFYDGYGPAEGEGFPVGIPAAGRRHNPSAALVKSTMVAGASRMRGVYTGDDGRIRAEDGQWPSAGQGFGLVNLDRSLYFPGDPATNWYRDVWRNDEDAFEAGADEVRSYPIAVQAPAAGGSPVPLDIALAWTDAPNLLPGGTPALVNNLDLVVTSPSGVVYVGNNTNTRLTPGAEDAESLEGPAPTDVRNVTERVRVLEPEEGTWTVAVRGTSVLEGPQGFALAAAGPFLPTGGAATGVPLQADALGAPTIGSVSVETTSADTTEIRFSTSEPTTAKAVVAIDGTDVEFSDVYTYSAGSRFIQHYEAAAPETSPTYADTPVLSDRHEILVFGLSPGQSYTVRLVATDIGGAEGTASTTVQNTATEFQPSAADTAQLSAANSDVIPSFVLGGTGWRTSTQIYVGKLSNVEQLGAFMFRLPETIDPATITGARVELTGAHMLTSFYKERPKIEMDLLSEEVHDDWGRQNFAEIKRAEATARLAAPNDPLVGGGVTHAYTLSGDALDALKASLESVDADGRRLAALRVTGLTELAGAAPSYEFGFNRRSRGPELRPRLVLTTANTVAPPAPTPDRPAPDQPRPAPAPRPAPLPSTGGLPTVVMALLAVAALSAQGLRRISPRATGT